MLSQRGCSLFLCTNMQVKWRHSQKLLLITVPKSRAIALVSELLQNFTLPILSPMVFAVTSCLLPAFLLHIAHPPLLSPYCKYLVYPCCVACGGQSDGKAVMTDPPTLCGCYSLVGEKLATRQITKKKIYNDKMNWMSLSGVQIALSQRRDFDYGNGADTE